MAGIIDYTPQVFTGYYVQNGAKYCYTVYPEFYCYQRDGALHYSDKLNVIAVTPFGGTLCFALVYDKDNWQPFAPLSFVSDKLLRMINKNMKKVTEKNPLIRVTVSRSK
jgi:hypothetical protein